MIIITTAAPRLIIITTGAPRLAQDQGDVRLEDPVGWRAARQGGGLRTLHQEAVCLLCYVMVPLLHTHQRRKQLGVVASCDISQYANLVHIYSAVPAEGAGEADSLLA
jgi:hypothetical protein